MIKLRTQITNSKYSFEILDKGGIKIYRCDEDITEQLNYNIVYEMACMIDDLLEKLNETPLDTISEDSKENTVKVKFRFSQDFANNWKENDCVTCEVRKDGTTLVDGVALVNTHELVKHGYFESTEFNENWTEEFARIVGKSHGWQLMSRGGNPSSEIAYSYNYVDNDGISITLYPDSKEFKFMYVVDGVFTLQTPTAFSPFDHDNGKFFMKNYKKFIDLVWKFKENSNE